MNKISESIFSGKVGVDRVVIPMANVIYVVVEDWGGKEYSPVRQSYYVHLKKGMVKLNHIMGKKFMPAWCHYRHEIEGGKKAFKKPTNRAKEE